MKILCINVLNLVISGIPSIHELVVCGYEDTTMF